MRATSPTAHRLRRPTRRRPKRCEATDEDLEPILAVLGPILDRLLARGWTPETAHLWELGQSNGGKS